MRFCLAAAAVLAVAAAGANPAADPNPLTPPSDGKTPTCDQKCDNTFAPHTNDKDPDQLKTCSVGCRLLSIIEAVDHNPLDRSLDLSGSLKNCNKSCDASYKAEKERDSCKLGCSFQAPLSLERRKNVKVNVIPIGRVFPVRTVGFPPPPPSFFGGRSGPGVAQPLPGPPGPPPGLFSGFPDLGGIFNKMHQQMNKMMDAMMNQAEDLENGKMPEGAGRLTVIKSGPDGVREEKTYDFKPGRVEKTETKTDEDGNEVVEKTITNDALEHANPLDVSHDDDEVEMIPADAHDVEKEKIIEVKEKEEEEEERKRPEERMSLLDILAPFNKATRTREFGSSVHGFDFNDVDVNSFEGSGDFQPLLRRVHPAAFCSRPSDQMKWSDWVSCLHVRMGLPRWLTACTISLGIVFVIWLCLVIPHSAPKQRVPKNTATNNAGKSKAMEAAGKLDKEHLSRMADLPPAVGFATYKLDLPPAYEDIANLHVAVPVLAAATSIAAESEKKDKEPRKEEEEEPKV